MSRNQAKVQFNADVSEFNKKIRDVGSEISELTSSLKRNATSLKQNGDSVDGLAERHNLLSQQSNNLSSKIGLLEAKLSKSNQLFGESSVESERLRTQINNATNSLDKINGELLQVDARLKDAADAEEHMGSVTAALERTIGQQQAELKRLHAEYGEAVSKLGKTSAEARTTASQIDKLTKSLDKNKDTLKQAETGAEGLKSALSGIASVAGISAVASGLSSLEESTRQYRNEQNKLEAVAQTSGQSLDALQGSYSDLYAITGDETLASTATLNMSAMGMSVAEQESIVNSATGAWAAYGDSIPLDGLLESINETSRAGQVTGSFADALNWADMTQQQWSASLAGNKKAQSAFNKAMSEGMSVEDAFNEALKQCTTTQERQELITAAMNGAYGELGKTYQETNEDVIEANKAQQSMSDGMAALGEAVQPVTTFFQNLIGNSLQWLADNLPTLTPLITALGVAIGGLLVVVSVNSGLDLLQKVLPLIGGALGAIGAPALIIIGVLATLAGAFMYLWNTSETFRNSVMQIWTAIQTVFGTLAEWFMTTVVTPVVTYFMGLKDQLMGIWNGISEIVGTVLGKIVGFIQDNMGTIQAIWSVVWGVISTVVSTVWGAIQTVINTALGIIQGIIDVVMGVISGDWSRVWDGIRGIVGSVLDAIGSVVQGGFNFIQGIVSSVGGAIGGIIDTVFGGIHDTITNVITGAKDFIKNGLDGIKGFFSGLKLELPKIKLPHFSISGNFSLNPPSIPHFSVKWYAEGGIMNAPTLFGAMGSTLLGGGEAGAEAILPIEKLQGFIDVAFQRNLSREGYDELIEAVRDLADRETVLNLNGREFARATASDTDRVNGGRQRLVNRGVSLS